jgi:uncharacterized protein YyaL (SSP411 family)
LDALHPTAVRKRTYSLNPSRSVEYASLAPLAGENRNCVVGVRYGNQRKGRGSHCVANHLERCTVHSSGEGAPRCAERAGCTGGFRYDEKDRGGPFLDDNLAMTQAFLALYRSTGERSWLMHATDTLNFIDENLRQADAGFVAAPRPQQGRGVFSEAVRLPEQNAALVRASNMANRCTGNPRYRKLALHGMKYLAAVAAAADDQLLPDILLADRELSTAPIHIAILGAKRDPAAQSLHAAALRYPADYLQIDWLDRSEGELPNRDIQYPPMDHAAAFACADGACSSPVYEAREIEPTVRKLTL